MKAMISDWVATYTHTQQHDSTNLANDGISLLFYAT